MPNWVENDLYIEGKPRRRKAAVADLAGPNGVVDFNSVIPMPEFLRFTPSPPRDHMLGERDPMKWPWVQELGLTEIAHVRDHIVEKFKGWELQFGSKFEHQCFVDKELVLWGEYLSAVARMLMPETPDWYEWSVKNWGVKWNACQERIVRPRPSHKITFNTAWSAPIKVISALAAKHPEASFTLCSFERGMGWKRRLVIVGERVVSDEKKPYSGERGG